MRRVRARDVQLISGDAFTLVEDLYGVLIIFTGVAENVRDDDNVPDASARPLRARLRELTGASPAVLITDSFGRAWRHGQCDVALGCAGMAPLEDWRGRTDSVGLELRATWIAVADAAAAHRRPRSRQGLARAGRADRRARAVRHRRGRPRCVGAAAAAGRGPVPMSSARPEARVLRSLSALNARAYAYARARARSEPF